LLRSFLAALAAIVVFAAAPVLAQTADPANTLVMETSKGRVVIAMRPDLAPKHVEQIKALVAEKFYDGIVFHRVIDGFMAQTGDPTGTGMGGSKLPDIPAEFSGENFGRRWRLPERPVHGLGPGRGGHGRRRPDQQGRAAGEPGQDHHPASGQRRRLTRIIWKEPTDGRLQGSREHPRHRNDEGHRRDRDAP
jgi:hypothetical protein